MVEDDNNRATLEALRKAKKLLNKRESEAIGALFPEEGKPPTLKELGERFGVSESGMFRIRSRALEKLRKAMEMAA